MFKNEFYSISSKYFGHIYIGIYFCSDLKPFLSHGMDHALKNILLTIDIQQTIVFKWKPSPKNN